MSEMEYDNRTLSRHLWGILDSIGLSPEMREAVTKTVSMTELLWTLEQGANGHNTTVYISGSKRDATTTVGLRSDADVIPVLENTVVVDDLQNAPSDTRCYLLFRDTDTPAGYAKLHLVEADGIPVCLSTTEKLTQPYLIVDKQGRKLRNNRWPDYWFDDIVKSSKREQNGPAITLIWEDGEMMDSVPTYRCASWPGVAMEWLTRDRHHNWPTQDQIQKLRSLGYYVVGVGHPHSAEQTLEWRISFWLQERYLVMSFNAVQYKCYVLMKMVKTDCITSQLPDSISSYHCKTVIFYAIESTPADFWVQDNLVDCLLHCLGLMHKCAVDGVCPSYFIPKANLFDRRVHGELRKQVVSLLNELLKENGMFLFRINCDNIGAHLSSAFNKSAAPVISSLVMAKHEPTIWMNTVGDVIGTVTRILNCSSATFIETLQDKICRLTSTTRVAEHTECQTREAVHYLLPHLHISLASHLAASLLHPYSGKGEPGNIRELMEEHIQVATSSGLTLCLLKATAIFYMLEEYNKAEALLSDAAAALSRVVINSCQIQSSVVDDNKHILLDTLALEGRTYFMNSRVSYCISFQPSELAVTPAALQYEMFKSRRPQTEKSKKRNWWYNWSNVDANVFLHYMQYLLYDKLGDFARRHCARNELIDVTETDASIRHRETAYNLLGWIFKREGDYINAARYFLNSIRMEPEDNAAKWHIGDLYLRQTMASRPCPQQWYVTIRSVPSALMSGGTRDM